MGVGGLGEGGVEGWVWGRGKEKDEEDEEEEVEEEEEGMGGEGGVGWEPPPPPGLPGSPGLLVPRAFVSDLDCSCRPRRRKPAFVFK